MGEPVDYGLLDELIADESLSLRECARRAGCSDWTARQRSRELTGDDRPMKAPRGRHYQRVGESQDEPTLTATEKAVVWSVVALVFIGLVALSWYARRKDLPPYYFGEGPTT
jgi:hypothetical protein